MNLNFPCKVKIDFSAVRKHDPCEPYLRLIHKMVRDGGGTVLAVKEDRPGFVAIRAHEYDFLGDAVVPASACAPVVEVKKAPLRGETREAIHFDDRTCMPDALASVPDVDDMLEVMRKLEEEATPADLQAVLRESMKQFIGQPNSLETRQEICRKLTKQIQDYLGDPEVHVLADPTDPHKILIYTPPKDYGKYTMIYPDPKSEQRDKEQPDAGPTT
jgi:hypothetical protein